MGKISTKSWLWIIRWNSQRNRMVRDSLPTLGPHLLVNVLCQGRSSVGRELFLGCCTVISAVNDLLVEELDLEKRRAYTTRHITWHLFTHLKLHCIFIINDHLEVVSLKLWDPNCWFAFPSRWNNVFSPNSVSTLRGSYGRFFQAGAWSGCSKCRLLSWKNVDFSAEAVR